MQLIPSTCGKKTPVLLSTVPMCLELCRRSISARVVSSRSARRMFFIILLCSQMFGSFSSKHRLPLSVITPCLWLCRRRMQWNTQSSLGGGKFWRVLIKHPQKGFCSFSVWGGREVELSAWNCCLSSLWVAQGCFLQSLTARGCWCKPVACAVKGLIADTWVFSCNSCLFKSPLETWCV